MRWSAYVSLGLCFALPAGTGVWQQISTQLQWPETDLYLGVWATKAPSCPWDCVGNDGEIGIDEFLAVLGRWGVAPNNPCDFDGDGMIGINEFLKVLGLWGLCP